LRMSPARFLVAAILVILPCGLAAGKMEGIRVSQQGTGFVYEPSGRPFVPWGLNYDHNAQGRLLEDYWEKGWPKVEDDFRAMKRLGANVVRISPERPARIERPIDLAAAAEAQFHAGG